MSLSIRRFFVPAILFFVALSVVSGEARRAFAQTGPETIEVFPANIDPRPAEAGEDLDCSADRRAECTVQQLVDMAAPGDVVMFMPSASGEDPYVYDDVGEILVTADGGGGAGSATTETVTIRGMAGGEDMITFTGKVMFNVKASNIVIKGFRFKDTEVPDAVTMRVAGSDPATTPAIQYGFPGKTILEHLIDVDDDWSEGDAYTQANIDSKGGINRFNSSSESSANLALSNQDFVTVPSGYADAGKISRRSVSARITESGSGAAKVQLFVGDAIPAFVAQNVMGTVWVDSVPRTGTCTGPYLKNVQVRNNKFENTYLAGVRAGNHSWFELLYLKASWTAPQLPGVNCSAHVEIVGNEFVDVGENGPFVKDSNKVVRDSDGNRVADHGNREAAISLSGIGSSGAGASAAPSMITDNTIVGGTADAIVLAGSADDAKVVIAYNRISNSLLNGINIVASPRSSTDRDAEITVEGNLINGASNNRFLTKGFRPIGGEEGAQPGSTWPQRYTLPGETGDSIWVVEQSCIGYTDAASRNSLRRRIMPEIWTSLTGGIPFPSTGAPVSFINDTASPADNRAYGAPTATGIASSDVIRYKADECYNLGRVRILYQQGVTVRDNDLGYAPDPDIAGSPKNGVVVEGTGVSLEEFTGNNIDFYKDYAVLNAGDGFSAAMNYLGIRPLVSGDVEGTGDLASEPLAGAGRVIGPRERYAMPDEEPPALVESGDGAPAVNGAVLTLAFNDALDGTSVPAGGAFEVKSVVGGDVVYHVVESVAISGTTVTLTLVEAVARGAAITVSYDAAAAGDGMIRDDAGLALASFENKAVTNGTPAAPGTGTQEPVDARTPGGGGGCALASAGSGGTGFGALLLAMLPFAFCIGGKKKNAV